LTNSWSLDAEQSVLTAVGATRISAEKVSGAVIDFRALAKAIATRAAADVLLVTRLDRLTRSTELKDDGSLKGEICFHRSQKHLQKKDLGSAISERLSQGEAVAAR
jgi:hypothetical protein